MKFGAKELLRRAPPLGIFLMGAMMSQADSMRPPTSTPTPIEGTNTMPFESVNIGHRKLSYLCRGSGSPTVIAEGGPGFSFSEALTRPKPIGWQLVYLQVKNKTRMCVYDRANVGKSDKAPTPRTILDADHDLHALLRHAHIKPPYVLIGQSAGGLNVRLYASLFPKEVVGMVLIDSSHPDQWAKYREVLPPESPGEWWELPGLRNGPAPSFSPEGIEFTESAAQVRATGSLGDIPLIVLTRDPQWAAIPELPRSCSPS
jgi:pimeloyl-ACP methyl ester carboxylesterase